MKNIFRKILILICISIGVFSVANAGVDFGKYNDDTKAIQNVSNSLDSDDSKTIVENIEAAGFSILTSIKVIFTGVLLIFMVYIGVQMIVSMGDNEEMLKKAKNQIWYTAIAIVLINIPGTIFKAFQKDNYNQIDGGNVSWSSESGNIFINNSIFKTLNENIVGALEISIGIFALIMIIYSGIQIINSRGREEKITESKNKILWAIVALVFVGFIESYKRVVFKGDIEDGANLFDTMANLALFFAGPVGIFFITLAGYYFITSNGDEERIKKAKSIIINTVIATVLLLASYSFLLDLAKF